MLYIKEMIGLDALSLFKSRPFATLMIASVLTCIPLSFYFGFTASFLSDIGMDFIPNKISLGQVSEIIFLLIDIKSYFNTFLSKGVAKTINNT